MSETNKREAPVHPVFSIDEFQMYLGSLMSDCKTERNEATSVAERMFYDGRILLLHELIRYLEAEAKNAAVKTLFYKPPIKAGRWEFENGVGDFAAGQRTVPCSECHTRQYAHLLDHYCPHCGVYMPKLPTGAEVGGDE